MEECKDYKTAYKFWYQGKRIRKNQKCKSPNTWWFNHITPPKGTEAWYQIARGISGECW
jgi:hypothetical protein